MKPLGNATDQFGLIFMQNELNKNELIWFGKQFGYVGLGFTGLT